MKRVAVGEQLQLVSEVGNHHVLLECGHIIIANGPAEIGEIYLCSICARCAKSLLPATPLCNT